MGQGINGMRPPIMLTEEHRIDYTIQSQLASKPTVYALRIF